jgi:PASTA domain
VPRVFIITAPAGTIRVNAEGAADATFTVSNGSERPQRALAKVVPLEGAQAGWFQLAGESDRDLPVQGSTQYTVRLGVPKGTPEGSYKFRLDVVTALKTGDEAADGPTVVFEVPETKKPVNPVPFIIAGAVVLLLVIGGVIWLLMQKRVPSVTGQTIAAAEGKLQGAKIPYRVRYDYSASAGDSTVLSQEPAGGKKYAKADTVQLVVNQKTVVVPDVRNVEMNAAAQTLLDAILVPVLSLTEDNSMTAGNVIRTDPPNGTTISREQRVSVFVAVRSSGGGGIVFDPGRFRTRAILRRDLIEANERIMRAGNFHP